MNGNSNLYAHSQIDNEINNNTLLSLITGGRYQTSGDIPPLSTTGKLTNENLNRALKAFLGISVGMPMKGLRGEMPFEEYLNREPEVLYPAGKNIFGQPTEPVTQEDLLSLVMGTLGPGQGARGALFGKAGRAEMKPLIDKLTKDIEKMEKVTKATEKADEFYEVMNNKFIYRSLLNYLNRYGEGLPNLSRPSAIPHYIDSIYNQGNLVARKLKKLK